MLFPLAVLDSCHMPAVFIASLATPGPAGFPSRRTLQ
jgi:hypothetical protein